MAFWMNRRGALTQPAVAPRPFMCRKIPAPRCRTWFWLKAMTIERSYWRRKSVSRSELFGWPDGSHQRNPPCARLR